VWASACEIAKQSVKLLPTVCTHSLNREDQQRVLESFTGLGAKMCSLVLETDGRVDEALTLLELSRGVMLGLSMDIQSDLREISVKHPDAAKRYRGLLSEINLPTIQGGIIVTDAGLVKRREEAVKKFKECVEDIRQIPGCERFLRAPSPGQLKKQITEGSIIVVNVSSIRSDAIIVSASETKNIHLSDLKFADAENYLKGDLKIHQNNVQYLKYLKWLWERCVRPILQGLGGIRKQPDCGEPLRIWWIGVGIASFFPFHAAGNYDNYASEKDQNALFWTIPSYIPTIKALNHLQKRPSTASYVERLKPDMMVATMSTTPEANPLPGADREGSELETLFGSIFSIRILPQPNVNEVLKQLEHCDLAHFACHGVSDPVDPSNSCLIFEKSTLSPSVRTQDRLTVRQLSGIHLDHSQIAYLSACSTAQNRAVRLLDEAIHVVAGFHIAGFGHVIGCMWRVDDSVCVDVAKGFYTRLSATNGLTNHKKTAAVAIALRETLMDVRSEWIKVPLDWAAYIHFGP